VRVEINGEKAIGLIQTEKDGVVIYNLRWKKNGKTPKLKMFSNLELAKKAWLLLHPPNSVENVTIVRNAQGIAILPCLRTHGIKVDDDIFIKYYGKAMQLKSPNYPTLTINRKLCGIHRLVMEAKDNEWVDHINSDRQDARRCNLRITDPKKNAHNKLKSKSKSTTSSEYVGVYKYTDTNSFLVRIRHNNKPYYGGSYQDEKLAAWAASQLCIQLYGQEFARKYDIEMPGYIFKNNRAIKIDSDQKKIANDELCEIDDSGVTSEYEEDSEPIHILKKQKI
jgi:hypothetical protein